MSERIERVVTSGTFELDGGKWDVDNNVWLIGDDEQVIVVDPAHEAAPILDGVAGREVVATFPVRAGDHLMLVTDGGQLIRIEADAVRITGRQGMGVMLMRLAEGERVISCFPVADEEESGEDNAPPEETTETP